MICSPDAVVMALPAVCANALVVGAAANAPPAAAMRINAIMARAGDLARMSVSRSAADADLLYL
jgi:hypothetical protein